MKLMREEMFRRRMHEFYGPVGDLGNSEPIVHKILELYAHGHIITKEEALSQMVVQLATNKDELQKRVIDTAMMTSHLTIPPHA